MRHLLNLLAVGVTIVCLWPTGAQAQMRSEHSIEVNVSCADTGLRNRITSFVSRELRQLGDVVITDTDPNYSVAIVAIAVSLQSGYEAGHAISVVITSPLGDWSWALDKGLEPDLRQGIANVLEQHESLVYHQLMVGNEENLRGTLERVIADFDAEHLEPQRVLWQRMQERKSKPAADTRP